MSADLESAGPLRPADDALCLWRVGLWLGAGLASGVAVVGAIMALIVVAAVKALA